MPPRTPTGPQGGRGFASRVVVGATVALAIALALAGQASPARAGAAPSPAPSQRTTEPYSIGIELAKTPHDFRVMAVLPGSPAAKAGVSVGDAILAVDGHSTADLTMAQLVDRIRGDANTTVTLSLAGKGDRVVPRTLSTSDSLKQWQGLAPGGVPRRPVAQSFSSVWSGLEARAKAGSPGAQLQLASEYFRLENAPKGLHWLRQAANRGDAGAAYQLAWLCDDGATVPRDSEEALAWYRRAAKGGNAAANYELGRHLDHGLGMAAKPREAVQFYERAAAAGNVEAYLALEQIYESGRAGRVDRVRARTYAQKAADEGRSEGTLALVRLMKTDPAHPADAGAIVALLQHAIAPTADEDEDQSAAGLLELLADAYARGVGVPRDAARAATLYERIGTARATFEAARLLDPAPGPNTASSVWELYRSGADQLLTEQVGVLGLPWNYDADPCSPGVAMLRDAARRGDASALWWQAWLADDRQGSSPEALALLHGAADKGSAAAWARLGQLQSDKQKPSPAALDAYRRAAVLVLQGPSRPGPDHAMVERALASLRREAQARNYQTWLPVDWKGKDIGRVRTKEDGAALLRELHLSARSLLAEQPMLAASLSRRDIPLEWAQRELLAGLFLRKADLADASHRESWLSIAALLGDPEAQSQLGWELESRGPVKLEQAYTWYDLGAAGGRLEAVAGREQVAARLSPAALARAQRKALDWWKSTYAD